jgi:uncharacterized membrane protein
MPKHSLIWKTIVVSIVVVLTNVAGNYALKVGLDEVGTVVSWSPVPYIRAFAHPWVAIGVTLMFAWMVSRLLLLSWADLSYVLPVTSFSYALSALAGALYLHEKVTLRQWSGIAAITIGTALVAFTFPETVVLAPPDTGESGSGE